MSTGWSLLACRQFRVGEDRDPQTQKTRKTPFPTGEGIFRVLRV
jgi:hypothetical protein